MMKKSAGVLNEKLRDYYEEGNTNNQGYRYILREAVMLYQGSEFTKVLDIGCGVGSFIDAISNFGFDLYGLEASEYGLKRSKAKGFNVKAFYLEENVPLPYEDNTFSLVVLNQVIEHVEKPVGQYYIKEIIRVLEPGGVAIVKSPSVYCKIWRTDPHHLYCWKPDELEKEIKKHAKSLSRIEQHRGALELWMFQNYNEKTIDKWHKNVKYPFLKEISVNSSAILDKLAYRILKTNRLLATANFNFVKDFK